MKRAIVLLLLVATSAWGNCVQIGDNRMCQDGKTYRSDGSVLFGQNDRPVTYDNVRPSTPAQRPEVSSTRIGNQRFYEDGTTSTQIGNHRFYSDGTTCTNFGAVTSCY